VGKKEKKREKKKIVLSSPFLGGEKKKMKENFAQKAPSDFLRRGCSRRFCCSRAAARNSPFVVEPLCAEMA
jgi:hypothetical protein